MEKVHELTLNNYKVLSKAGEGELGEVFKVKDERDGKIKALKISHHDDESKLRLKKEFQVLSTLKHPNIVEVYEFGELPDGRTYFVMEWVEGVPINKFFKGYDPKILNVLEKIISALDYIHSKGYIHSDLKPENIYVYEDEGGLNVKLLDFGFISTANLNEPPRGTLGYLAPEAFRGYMDIRSDFYSLGVILYEVLTGQKPFEAKTLSELVKRQNYEQYEEPVKLNSKIPTNLNTLIKSLLKATPSMRPSSTFEILKLLGIKSEAFEKRFYLFHPPFIGRRRYCRILTELKEKIQKGKPDIVLLRGERGSGKTRVLEEYNFSLQLDGYRVFYHTFKNSGTFLNNLIFNFVGQKNELKFNSKYEFFDNLTKAIVNTATKNRPIFLLLDDVESATKVEIEFLRYFFYSLTPRDHVGVIAAIDSSRGDEFPYNNKIIRVEVSPFGKEEIEKYIEGLLGEIKNVSQLAKWLLDEFSGNPLKTKRAIEVLIRNNILTGSKDGWEFRPDKLTENVKKEITQYELEAIKSLNSEEKRILKVLYNFRGPLPLKFIDAILEGDYTRSLKVLRDKELVKLRGELLEFASPAIEDLVRKNLNPRPEKRLSRKFYRLLTDYGSNYFDSVNLLKLLAEHALKCGLYKEAYECSVEAANEFERLFDFERAAYYYMRGIESATKLKEPPELFWLYIKLGDTLSIVGSYDESNEYYSKALESPTWKREAIRKIGRNFFRMGNLEEALKYFKKALLLSVTGDEKAEVLEEIAWVYVYQNNLKEAEYLLKQAEEKASKKLLPQIYYDFSALYWHKHDVKKSLKMAQKGLSLIEEKDENLLLMSWFYLQEAQCYLEMGKLNLAENYLKKAMSIKSKIKNLQGLLSAYVAYTELLNKKGQLELVEKHYLEGEKLALILKDEHALHMLQTNKADTLILKGDPEGAFRLCKGSILWFKKASMPQFLKTALDTSVMVGVYYFEQEGLLDDLIRTLSITEDYNYLKDLLNALRNRELLEVSRFILENFDKLTIETILGVVEKLLLTDHQDLAAALLKKIHPPPDGLSALRVKILKLLTKSQGDNIKEIEKLIASMDKSNSAYLYMTYKLLLINWKLTHYGDLPDISELSKLMDELHSLYKLSKNLPSLSSYVMQTQQKLIQRLIQERENTTFSKKYLSALFYLTEIIEKLLDERSFFDSVLELLVELTGAERGVLFILENGNFRVVATKGVDKDTIVDARRVSYTVIREASQKEEAIFVQDALKDPRFSSARSVQLNKIRSIICVPLVSKGIVIGSVYLDSRVSSGVFPEEEKDFLVAVSRILSATIDKTIAFRKLEEEYLYLKESLYREEGIPIPPPRSSLTKMLLKIVDKLAPLSVPVLVVGEPGTGKSAFAKFLHRKSGRKGPFVKFNSDVVGEKAEEILFGRKNDGLIFKAEEGTLYINEIAMISPSLIKEISKIAKELNVRLIFGITEEIEKLMKDRKLRESFFVGLNPEIVHIPPLRERKDDIPILAEYFLKVFNKKYGKNISGFTVEALQAMRIYPWPGNLKELERIIERGVLLASGNILGLEELSLDKEILKEPERKIEGEKELTDVSLKYALQATNGSIEKTAELLGKSEGEIKKALKKHKIKISKFKR